MIPKPNYCKNTCLRILSYLMFSRLCCLNFLAPQFSKSSTTLTCTVRSTNKPYSTTFLNKFTPPRQHYHHYYSPAATKMNLTGSCYCRKLTYEINLSSLDEARTSLCHCPNCKKAFGTNYGLTTKIPLSSFRYTSPPSSPSSPITLSSSPAVPKLHQSDNGSGSTITREFCDTCGSFILEYGEQAKDSWRYVCTGSLDHPEKVPPKGEFFCKYRDEWMPEVEGVFRKREIKE